MDSELGEITVIAIERYYREFLVRGTVENFWLVFRAMLIEYPVFGVAANPPLSVE